MSEIRPIDANALREELNGHYNYAREWSRNTCDDEIKFRATASSNTLAEVITIIDNAPTVEPERPQGEWVEKEETPASVSYYCSNCKREGIPITPFCPWCGASMRNY